MPLNNENFRVPLFKSSMVIDLITIFLCIWIKDEFLTHHILSLHSHFFIQKKKVVTLAPKNQHKTTSHNNPKEKSVTLNLSCIPSRGSSLHTSHIQVRESNWSSFLDNHHYKSRYVYHGYKTSSSTVFHHQQIHDQQSSIPEFLKAFVLWMMRKQ